MTRKRFLWVLGAGGAAITAEVLLPARGLALPAPTRDRLPEAEPRLRPEVAVAVDGEGLVLRCPSGASSIVCAVNAPGAEVVRRLDGRTPVGEIARLLSGRDGTTTLAEVEVKVACFVAQLAELGFLRAPYYALIAERR